MLKNIKNCSFCELLNDVRNTSEYYAKKTPAIKDDYTSECKIALVVEDSWRGEREGQISYNPRPLNFCPVCGRTIAKEEINW